MLQLAVLAMLFIGSFTLSPGDAVAEPYPSKPIKLVVAQPPGGQTDVIVRLLGDRLSELWKTPTVVEYHGGAGGTIGADLVAKAPADGYTLLAGGLSNLAIAAALVKDLRYDPIRDFAPVGGMARVPYALAVNRSVPATTLPELIAYARAHPGRLTYGSGGIASSSSLGAEMLKSMAEIDIVHVAYRGTAPSIQALVSGEVDMMFADLSLLAPHAKGGTLRLIAAAGAKRATAAPELPTVVEQGVPGFAIEPWYGVVAPVGTPPDVLAKLAEGLHETVRTREIVQRLEQLGYEPMMDTPTQFGAFIRSEAEKYAALIKRAGIIGAP